MVEDDLTMSTRAKQVQVKVPHWKVLFAEIHSHFYSSQIIDK